MPAAKTVKKEDNAILTIARKLIAGEYPTASVGDIKKDYDTLFKFYELMGKVVRPQWDEMIQTYEMVNGSDVFEGTEVKPLRKPRTKKEVEAKAIDLSGLDI